MHCKVKKTSIYSKYLLTKANKIVLNLWLVTDNNDAVIDSFHDESNIELRQTNVSIVCLVFQSQVTSLDLDRQCAQRSDKVV